MVCISSFSLEYRKTLDLERLGRNAEELQGKTEGSVWSRAGPASALALLLAHYILQGRSVPRLS